ncbi:MAG: DUF2213 domain-containing protein, partial [Candidatus Marinimicrobia bacterium]|nr:DUF2213 domain-containing protein [Candidatus Neomarinimicrobiota bacterium]
LTFIMDICRDGVQEYMADEIYGEDVLKENNISGDTILRVWRPSQVVFSDSAITAHNGLPLTREHPAEFVDENNRAYLEKGINRSSLHNKQKSTISGTGFVCDPLMVSEIESGEYNEISDGYDSELEFKPGVVPEGVTDSGQEYDLIMTGYTPNHIAMVKEGRAGNARIHDNRKNGGVIMSLFDRAKKSRKAVKKQIADAGKASVLRLLADEETDEEKKAVLDELATEAESADTEVESEDKCDPVDKTKDELNENTNLSNSETQDTDKDQKEIEIVEQKRIIEAKDSLSITLDNLKKARAIIADGKARLSIDIEIKDIETKLADNANKTTEVLNMDKKDLAKLIDKISVTVNDAMNRRFGDADKDITLDGEPTVIEEFEVDDQTGIDQLNEDMQLDNFGEPEVIDEFEVEDGVDAEALYEMAKNSQNPAIANLARSLAGELEKAGAEVQAESMESEDEGFIADMQAESEDAPPATEEARLASAAEGDAPETGTPSNQATEAELEAATKDGDKATDPVMEKDGYYIPKKLADAATLPVLMGNVIDTVSSYALKDIDVQTHLKDGTIYHRLIDASGIGKVTSSKGITRDRVSVAINAIRANRQKADGMSALVGTKLKDSSSGGFNPADEL